MSAQHTPEPLMQEAGVRTVEATANRGRLYRVRLDAANLAVWVEVACFTPHGRSWRRIFDVRRLKPMSTGAACAARAAIAKATGSAS